MKTGNIILIIAVIGIIAFFILDIIKTTQELKLEKGKPVEAKTPEPSQLTKQQFIDKLRPIANEIEKNYGIKTFITYSQASLESNWGNSRLTREANNIFGMKATASWKLDNKPIWTGETIEYVSILPTTEVAEFKKYANWKESVLDWANLISGASRYRNAYEYAKQGDLRNFAIAIKEGGYATDISYTKKLISRSTSVLAYV